MEARKKRQKPRYGFRVLGLEDQAQGSFDHKKIVEAKMIGFSGEGSTINRLGPLYYLSWATCQQTAVIPEHPHRGFEILSYVLSGEIIHRDSLGKEVLLKSGDLQIMHTGSGVEHEEVFWKPPISMLQIWFDPNFRKEVKQKPQYQYLSQQALVEYQDHEGWRRRPLAGGRALLELEAPVLMEEWNMTAHGSYSWQRPGYGLAALVLEGDGHVLSSAVNEEIFYQEGDFIVLDMEKDSELIFNSSSPCRLIVFELVVNPDYPLFPKP